MAMMDVLFLFRARPPMRHTRLLKSALDGVQDPHERPPREPDTPEAIAIASHMREGRLPRYAPTYHGPADPDVFGGAAYVFHEPTSEGRHAWQVWRLEQSGPTCVASWHRPEHYHHYTDLVRRAFEAAKRNAGMSPEEVEAAAERIRSGYPGHVREDLGESVGVANPVVWGENAHVFRTPGPNGEDELSVVKRDPASPFAVRLFRWLASQPAHYRSTVRGRLADMAAEAHRASSLASKPSPTADSGLW